MTDRPQKFSPCSHCVERAARNGTLRPPWLLEHPQRHSSAIDVCLDEGIFNLVERINNRSGVYTTDSCQGYPETESEDAIPPYVLTVGTVDGVHDLIDSLDPELNAKAVYSSLYALGANAHMATRHPKYRTKISFPYGIPVPHA